MRWTFVGIVNVSNALSPCDSLCLVKLILDCTLVPLIIFFSNPCHWLPLTSGVRKQVLVDLCSSRSINVNCMASLKWVKHETDSVWFSERAQCHQRTTWMIFEARKCVLGFHEGRRHAEFARPFYCIHIVYIKSFAQTPSTISDIVSSAELFFFHCAILI